MLKLIFIFSFSLTFLLSPEYSLADEESVLIDIASNLNEVKRGYCVKFKHAPLSEKLSEKIKLLGGQKMCGKHGSALINFSEFREVEPKLFIVKFVKYPGRKSSGEYICSVGYGYLGRVTPVFCSVNAIH
ncbi:hypothetical protein [Microbulbifer pacificus]|uniref:hypothetical protein n=1 Tax=Microbulbifer pacificus TaxID=407164 RepID=UPI00131A3E2E|nr:hypothetical protein [Microbulbifer pacificus]